MKKAVNALKAIWKDESAQGATEYILLLVVVVGVAFLFKGKIREMLDAKLGSLGGEIQGFTSGN